MMRRAVFAGSALLVASALIVALWWPRRAERAISVE